MKVRRFIGLLLGGLLALPSLRAGVPVRDSVLEAIRPAYRPLAELFTQTPEERPTAGNTVEIIRDGSRKLDMLVQDMMAAQDYIHMEYFEFYRDAESRLVRKAMELKAMDSLEVRYIEEDFMNIPYPNRFFNQMRRWGVEVGHYNILHLNRRNHQKIVTIDNAVAYTGGMNIGPTYFHEWDDTHIRVTGPCVPLLDKIYSVMWNRIGGNPTRADYQKTVRPVSVPEEAYRNVIVQMVSDEPDNGHEIMDSYIWLLDHCQDYLYIQTPYFTPPKAVREALKRAVARGLDVRLLIPEKTDMKVVDPANRSYYKECLEAGIRIFESSGRFNHSKIFVADDYVSSVGSANVDGRSLKLNYENNTYFYDEAVTRDFKEYIQAGMDASREVTLEWVEQWSACRKMGNGLARILAPQL